MKAYYSKKDYEDLLIKQTNTDQILDGLDEKQEITSKGRYKFDIRDEQGEVDEEKIKKIAKLILKDESLSKEEDGSFL